jgi:coproporphyrinogen III oxidase-like Fe-S oxidoreductase
LARACSKFIFVENLVDDADDASEGASEGSMGENQPSDGNNEASIESVVIDIIVANSDDTSGMNLSQLKEAIVNRRPDFEQEVLDADTRYNDLVMTALRTRKGLDLSLLSPEQVNYCKTQALRYEKDGLLVFEDQHLRLTRRGLFVSNMIMSDLMKV